MLFSQSTMSPIRYSYCSKYCIYSSKHAWYTDIMGLLMWSTHLYVIHVNILLDTATEITVIIKWCRIKHRKFAEVFILRLSTTSQQSGPRINQWTPTYTTTGEYSAERRKFTIAGKNWATLWDVNSYTKEFSQCPKQIHDGHS